MEQGEKNTTNLEGTTMETNMASHAEVGAARVEEDTPGHNPGEAHPAGDGGGIGKSRENIKGGEEAAADPAGHQPHHQWAQQPLPPGYAIDPVSGQVVFVGPVYQQPFYQQPIYQQPINPAPQPGVVYVQAETPEQVVARQALEQQRYRQIMQSFEQFAQGDATVSDLVKTLYTNTAQYDQLWKGALVGAAATVLLTSKPVREAMGKTFCSVFPGLKPQQKASGVTAPPTADPIKSGKE